MLTRRLHIGRRHLNLICRPKPSFDDLRQQIPASLAASKVTKPARSPYELDIVARDVFLEKVKLLLDIKRHRFHATFSACVARIEPVDFQVGKFRHVARVEEIDAFIGGFLRTILTLDRIGKVEIAIIIRDAVDTREQ